MATTPENPPAQPNPQPVPAERATPHFVVAVGNEREELQKLVALEADRYIEEALRNKWSFLEPQNTPETGNIIIRKWQEIKYGAYASWKILSHAKKTVVATTFSVMREYERAQYIKERYAELRGKFNASESEAVAQATAKVNKRLRHVHDPSVVQQHTDEEIVQELRMAGKTTSTRVLLTDSTGAVGEGIFEGEKVSAEGAGADVLNTLMRELVAEAADRIEAGSLATDEQRADYEQELRKRITAVVLQYKDQQDVKTFLGSNTYGGEWARIRGMFGDIVESTEWDGLIACNILDTAQQVAVYARNNAIAINTLKDNVSVRLFKARWGTDTKSGHLADKVSKLSSRIRPDVVAATIGVGQGAISTMLGVSSRSVNILFPFASSGATATYSALRRMLNLEASRRKVGALHERGVDMTTSADTIQKEIAETLAMHEIGDLTNTDGLTTEEQKVERYLLIQELLTESYKKSVARIRYTDGNIAQGRLQLARTLIALKRDITGNINEAKEIRAGVRKNITQERKAGEKKFRKLKNREGSRAATRAMIFGYGMATVGQEAGALGARYLMHIPVRETHIEALARQTRDIYRGATRQIQGVEVPVPRMATRVITTGPERGNFTVQLNGTTVSVRDASGTEVGSGSIDETGSVSIEASDKTVVEQVKATLDEQGLQTATIFEGATAGVNTHAQWIEQAQEAWKQGGTATIDVDSQTQILIKPSPVGSDIHEITATIQLGGKTIVLDGRMGADGTIAIDDFNNQNVDVGAVTKKLEGAGLVVEGNGQSSTIIEQFRAQGMVDSTNREGWDQYDIPNFAENNEQKFYWTIDPQTKNLKIDISKMMPDNPRLAEHLTIDASGKKVFADGHFEILITPDDASNTADASNTVREAIVLTVNVDGIVEVPEGSDVRKLFYVDDTGRVRTFARTVEVAQKMDDGKRWILSTVTGKGISEFDDAKALLTIDLSPDTIGDSGDKTFTLNAIITPEQLQDISILGGVEEAPIPQSGWETVLKIDDNGAQAPFVWPLPWRSDRRNYRRALDPDGRIAPDNDSGGSTPPRGGAGGQQEQARRRPAQRVELRNLTTATIPELQHNLGELERQLREQREIIEKAGFIGWLTNEVKEAHAKQKHLQEERLQMEKRLGELEELEEESERGQQEHNNVQLPPFPSENTPVDQIYVYFARIVPILEDLSQDDWEKVEIFADKYRMLEAGILEQIFKDRSIVFDSNRHLNLVELIWNYAFIDASGESVQESLEAIEKEIKTLGISLRIEDLIRERKQHIDSATGASIRRVPASSPPPAPRRGAPPRPGTQRVVIADDDIQIEDRSTAPPIRQPEVDHQAQQRLNRLQTMVDSVAPDQLEVNTEVFLRIQGPDGTPIIQNAVQHLANIARQGLFNPAVRISFLTDFDRVIDGAMNAGLIRGNDEKLVRQGYELAIYALVMAEVKKGEPKKDRPLTEADAEWHEPGWMSSDDEKEIKRSITELTADLENVRNTIVGRVMEARGNIIHGYIARFGQAYRDNNYGECIRVLRDLEQTTDIPPGEKADARKVVVYLGANIQPPQGPPAPAEAESAPAEPEAPQAPRTPPLRRRSTM